MWQLEQGTVEAFAAEWDDLAERVDAIPFVRPGWIAAWSRAFGGPEPTVFALRCQGRLAGIVPLVRSRGALRSPTNWHTPAFEPLAENDTALRELSARLVSDGTGRLHLGFLTRDSPAEAALVEAARNAGRLTLERVVMRSPYVPLQGRWEDYRGTLGGHLRRNLARRRRRLEEDEGAPVELRVLDGGDHLEELLARGFQLEGSGWKTEQGTAILSHPATERFYTEIARWAAERGWLRLAFLHVGERAIAFEMCLALNDALYIIKGGFDTKLSRYGPGALLTYDLIGWCFAHACDAYELLGDETAFKSSWTDHAHERVLLQVFGRSPAGLASYAAHAWGRPRAKRLKDRLSG
jgi:CelD/BcsL family acetyltransferase involved in cellulose biosynthesis